MTTTICAKRVWTSHGWLPCAKVSMENGIITRVEPDQTPESCTVPVLIPGMIDMHIHGALGYPVLRTERKENERWLKKLAEHGVTGVLPTLSSSPPDKIRSTVSFYDAVMRAPVSGGAKVLGVHLEGPFLNPVKKGGIDERFLHAPSYEHYRTLVGECEKAVRIVTLAPELEGADELICRLVKDGIRINVGHSDALAHNMRRAISLGADGVTHFFNAARPMTHREPGFLAVALLNERVFCEMIGDRLHLSDEILALLVRTASADRLSVISDAGAYTGLPDGEYENRIVKDGAPRLPDGTLTGGRYLMDGCARALIGIGIDPYDVFRMTSNTPARRLGRHDLGDIAAGCAADLVAMDESYHILFTMTDGQEIRPTDSKQ